MIVLIPDRKSGTTKWTRAFLIDSRAGQHKCWSALE
jgi:hypothetical protein